MDRNNVDEESAALFVRLQLDPNRLIPDANNTSVYDALVNGQNELALALYGQEPDMMVIANATRVVARTRADHDWAVQDHQEPIPASGQSELFVQQEDGSPEGTLDEVDFRHGPYEAVEGATSHAGSDDNQAPDNNEDSSESLGRLEGYCNQDSTQDSTQDRTHSNPDTVNGKETTTDYVQCVICQFDVVSTAAAQVSCSHHYCVPCLSEHFNLSFNDLSLFPPRCCGQPIDPVTLDSRMPDNNIMTAYAVTMIEHQTEDKTYCSNRGCFQFLYDFEINTSLSVGICTACSRSTCTMCKNEAHTGECLEEEGLLQLAELANQQKWKRCPACRTFIDLIAGCNHVTCPCGHNFCYNCGKHWDIYNRECNCPQWPDEQLLLDEILDDLPQQPPLLGGDAIAVPWRYYVAAAQEHLEYIMSDLIGGHGVPNPELRNPQQLNCHHDFHRIEGYCDFCRVPFGRVHECRLCDLWTCTACREMAHL